MKPVRTWILIANGAHAHIVLNDGPGHGVKGLKGLEFARGRIADTDKTPDRQGRTFDSHGTGRHAKEPANHPERLDERKFIQEIVNLLDVKLGENAFDRLIIIASPTTLGDIRDMLTAALTKRLYAEIPKDLTHLSLMELPAHLEEFLAV